MKARIKGLKESSWLTTDAVGPIEANVTLEAHGTTVTPKNKNINVMVEADSIEIIEEKPKELKEFDFGLCDDVVIGIVTNTPQPNLYVPTENGELSLRCWRDSAKLTTVLGNLKDIVAEMQNVKDGKTETIEYAYWKISACQNIAGDITINVNASEITLNRKSIFKLACQLLALAREVK